MNILIISFLFEPEKKVGAKRMSYWAKNIGQYGVHCDVLTTTETGDQFDQSEINVYTIPLPEKKPILSRFIKDAGVIWKQALVGFINKNQNQNYDAVIISGDPFMHFGIAKQLKKSFGSKIIFDFRDPFANNPSFNNSFLKNKIKSFFEKKFLKNADLIITVNQFCYDIITKASAKKIIIENGFDETALNTIVDNTKQIKKNTIAHAGTFTEYRSPDNFLEALNGEDFVFQQYGAFHDSLKQFESNPRIQYKGFVDYKDLLIALNEIEIGVIVTEGKEYESTTKVFDYMGLNKKILIITSGELYFGNIHKITKDYPNIVWVNNQVEEIKKGLKSISNIDLMDYDASRFSRKEGLKKLVEELKIICK